MALAPHKPNSNAHSVFCVTELHNLILDLATPASYYVFKDLRLFTGIFLHVPSLELLRSCIYVCKQWHVQLNTSRLLFFHPQPYPFTKPIVSWDPDDEDAPMDNPNDPEPDDDLLNPFLLYAFPEFLVDPDDESTRRGYYDKLSARDFSYLPWLKNPDAWRRNGASWRRMQITHPPTVYLGFHALWAPETRTFDGSVMLRHEVSEEPHSKGYTLGQLYDYWDEVLLNGDELDGRWDRPECELRLGRQCWDEGGCEIRLDLFFFGHVGRGEGPGDEEMWSLRSEAFERWKVYMNEDVLP